MTEPDILSPFVETHGVTVYQGDCIETMRRLPENSVDAIVTDPPYGLEFMGKGWDSFRVDDPGTNRNRGDRAGSHGELVDVKDRADRRSPVAYGGGKRPSTFRCTGCGKRDQFRNDHDCAASARWARELIDPYAAPPTMLAFAEWTRTWALEAYRVLKPGGHLLAFAGTRTYHRMASGVEDAGFEIRDCIAWMYGSGFPKSLDVSKAIDKVAGAEREVVGSYDVTRDFRDISSGRYGDKTTTSQAHSVDVTAPATPDAAKWSGWGTALKPAFEPIVVARKPLIGTVAQNVLEHGTGAINVDGCRIGATVETWPSSRSVPASGANIPYAAGQDRHTKVAATGDAPPGRWPANVTLDEDAAAMLDEQSGIQKDGVAVNRNRSGIRPQTVAGVPQRIHSSEDVSYRGSGGASRFFYTAKASKKDRNTNGANNTHPTVKPTTLMRWLIRLVTPPGGIILDPFGGSGSTGVAARAEGVRCILIEREAEYLDIIRQRLDEGPLFANLD
jgi:DNA modification methylase